MADNKCSGPTLTLPAGSDTTHRGEASRWNLHSAPPDVAALLPSAKDKLLHFVRHAEGTHNVDRHLLKTPAAHDARLTQHGIAQCASLQLQTSVLKPALVVASPLTRTLQTAGHIFGQHLHAADMAIVALEQVRETVNFQCDGRRALSVIRDDPSTLLPAPVDFDQCAHDHDEIWASYERQHGSYEAYDGLRETADMPALHARAQAAIAWLGARPEREIVVVSHAAFLRHLFAFGHEPKGELGRHARVVEYADSEASNYMRCYFGNAECRSVVAHFA